MVTEAPKADLSGLLGGNEIKVRAGEPIKVDIPIIGSPTPKVVWKKDGKIIPESTRVGSAIWRYMTYFES